MTVLNTYDLMTLKAAEYFGVPPEEVTPTQRQLVKKRCHAENYSAGEINTGKMVGSYPPRDKRELL